MKDNPLAIGTIVLACTISVIAAVLWLTTGAGVPSETAVPFIIVVLLAVRFAARRRRKH